jgi:osmotically-inducible protein OsmY
MKSFPRSAAILTLAFLGAASACAISACAATATHEGTGGYVDDSTVTTKVKAALLGTQGVDSTEITVETFKGVVKLSGFLDSKEMIALAVNAAEGVNGVRSVTNDMTVKGQQGLR